MKFTQRQIKEIIREEINKVLSEATHIVDVDVVSEQEDTNAMIDDAQSAIEQEAIAAFNKIKSAADKAKMSPEMLKGLFIQFVQNMK
tara:strand:+ start:521 stop:781 length:261 start_codon:yes stop_codon:yes gene_type:complete